MPPKRELQSSEIAALGHLVPSSHEDELDQLAEAIRESLVISGGAAAVVADAQERGADDAPPDAADGAAAEAGPEEEPAPEYPADARGLQWPSRVAVFDQVPPFGGDARFYAVWRFSGNAAPTPGTLLGVHASFGTVAYQGLLALNGGSFGGLRWRRYPDIEEVVRSWKREAPTFKLVGEPPFYWWANRDSRR